ncbi:MAG: anaerobic ribonucleoside-triphosphate reductase activating protein [Methanoregulaceae archaeon]|jgi:pyruvate formate lyase activating enzyme|nr:anaerobic ribonucleoside-triphosphate reductase activating protein [Methanoregulaceae archaeon]
METVIRVNVNYGGFVDASTKDWPGRSVCTVFLRGCPLRCSYCHNAAIQTGKNELEISEVVRKIDGALLLISGVIFSGGEPTLQGDALIALARAAKERGLLVGLQTNGYFPDVLARLIDERLVDRVALDFKTRWEGYSRRMEGYAGAAEEDYSRQAQRSVQICEKAWREGSLPEFEIVLTLFWENEKEVLTIAETLPRVTIVLNQGVRKRFWKEWELSGKVKGKPYLSESEVKGERPPLSYEELAKIGGKITKLGRTIKIRTRDAGEVVYESDRSRGVACQR